MERTHRPAQPPPGKKPETAPKEERQLDKALEETFPSSDPVSISVPEKETQWTEEELAEADRKRQKEKSRTV